MHVLMLEHQSHDVHVCRLLVQAVGQNAQCKSYLCVAVNIIHTSAARSLRLCAGYDRKVNGDTAQERLDLRCAMKTDKFCK